MDMSSVITGKQKEAAVFRILQRELAGPVSSVGRSAPSVEPVFFFFHIFFSQNEGAGGPRLRMETQALSLSQWVCKVPM